MSKAKKELSGKLRILNIFARVVIVTTVIAVAAATIINLIFESGITGCLGEDCRHLDNAYWTLSVLYWAGLMAMPGAIATLFHVKDSKKCPLRTVRLVNYLALTVSIIALLCIYYISGHDIMIWLTRDIIVIPNAIMLAPSITLALLLLWAEIKEKN